MYAEALATQDVNGRVFAELDAADLKERGQLNKLNSTLNSKLYRLLAKLN